jgi:hypothetical protein
MAPRTGGPLDVILAALVHSRRMTRAVTVRRRTLEQQGDDDDVRQLSPSARVAMMWQLALQAWMFKEGLVDEPRLRRDVVGVVRQWR